MPKKTRPPIDPITTTKSRTPRKGKPNIRAGRLALREVLWTPTQSLIREYLGMMPHGEQQRMARALDISASQIHRYACDRCQHEQEPTFTIGVGMLLYMGHNLSQLSILKKQWNGKK